MTEDADTDLCMPRPAEGGLARGVLRFVVAAIRGVVRDGVTRPLVEIVGFVNSDRAFFGSIYFQIEKKKKKNRSEYS